MAVVDPGPFTVQFTLAPAEIASEEMVYPAGNPPASSGPTFVQFVTGDPCALLAVRAAKLDALTVVNDAAIPLVAFWFELEVRLINRGTAMVAIMPIKTSTTTNSTSVKPLLVEIFFDIQDIHE